MLMNLLDKCRSFTMAKEAIAGGYYPYFVPFEGGDGATATLDGREIVMAGSNSYLGLTKDPRVLEASRKALEASGSSMTGSRLLNGNLRLHEELEEELADFLGKESAIVFSTGFGANLGTVGALAGREDEVVLDAEAHASSIDGARGSGARVSYFAHNDSEDLDRVLARASSDGGRLVVVDGVYSMAGDLGRLPEIVRVCRRHGAQLLVDDAHGAGVVGGGRGTSAFFDVTAEVDLITVTFSKAFASIGGAAAGDADVVHYLRHHARAQIFSASMTPANTAAALASVRIARSEPWRGVAATGHASYVAAALRELGYDVGPTQSPIVPVLLGDLMTTVLLWCRLMELGVYVNAVLPPAASPRLRASFTATHTTEQLDRVVDAFRVVADEGLVQLDENSVA
jgi:8-amino-7-oxononanoate synthase